MVRRTMAVLSWTVAVVVVLVSAGCRTPAPATATMDATASGTGSSVGGSGGTGPDPSTPPGTVAQDRQADERRAERAVLVPADLPGTWTEGDPNPPDESKSEPLDCGSFSDEVEEADRLGDAVPEGRSPYLLGGNGAQLTEVVGVFAGQADADRLMSIYSDRAMPDCIARLVRQQASSGSATGSTAGTAPPVSVIGEPDVSVYDVTSDADDTVGFRIDVQIEQGGKRGPVSVVFVYLRVDRAVAQLQLTTVGAPPKADVQQIVDVAAVKLREFLGGR